MKKNAFDIIKAFNNYKDNIFKVDNDLNFWRSFLELSIKNYQNQNINPAEIQSALFAVYNIDSISNEGLLTLDKKSISIKTDDLEEHRVTFFAWIMNLSILKSYNAVEVFLLQMIWLRYYPTLNNPTSGKSSSNNLQKEIKIYLANFGLSQDTTNNRHVIGFLRSKSKNINDFLKNPIRGDLTTTWGDYFELLSTLRNIIAHQGTIITLDTLNGIKSKSRDIFERHFTITVDSNEERHINPKEGSLTGLINLMNDFAVNSVKFIYDETDFRFLKPVSV